MRRLGATVTGTGHPISALDAYNAVNDPPLVDDVGWTPALVGLSAGANRLPW